MKIGRYIVGLISGLTFGMLFAPKKGKKLRDELISKKGGSGHEALMVLYKAFKDAGIDAASEMKRLSENEQLQSVLDMSKDKMRAYLAEVEESGYDLAARAQEKVDEFADVATEIGSDFKKRAVKKRAAVKKAVGKRVAKAKKAVKPKVKRVTKKLVGKKVKKTSPKKSTTARKKSTSKKKKA